MDVFIKNMLPMLYLETDSIAAVHSGCESSDVDRYWVSGLFDKGSWTEAHSGWAKTVVTGRARLGGFPIGVIAVETQTVTKNIPADPGMPESSEQMIPQAGQVWFPDSATKTALAMEEFNLEGLPLMVLANWRGFSGGQRDLFEGILQAGSLIVENLRSYKQPAFVYLPPGAELRGGAWVVVDSQINPTMVELYADPSARGGVLEPEGVVEIKYRRQDLIKTIHRLDPLVQKLKGLNDEQGAADRIEKLLPVYRQVAVQFAEMHDKPTRMGEKGVMRGVVPWKHARSFFVQRLKRRLTEEVLTKHIESADETIVRPHSLNILRDWFLNSLLEDDGDVLAGMLMGCSIFTLCCIYPGCFLPQHIASSHKPNQFASVFKLIETNLFYSSRISQGRLLSRCLF